MNDHETNEKNQVKELSKVELSELSKEEMRSTTGGLMSFGRVLETQNHAVTGGKPLKGLIGQA